MSGANAHAIARRITTHDKPFEPRLATVTMARSADRSACDEIVATLFERPASYTGEDVVELSAHGSPVILQTIVDAAMRAGARLAEPGEFTLRAYLNGRIDLPQAEAVADLVDAVTPLQARAAFDQLQGTLTRVITEIDAELFDAVARLEASVDFPDEGYHFVDPRDLGSHLDTIADRLDGLLASAQRGRLIREGLQVAIVGRPNVGKSSLFNALVGSARAIVTEIPGTTRDLVSEVTEICGVRVTLIDTAGWRETRDRVEAEGVNRSRAAVDVADLVLVVMSRSEPLTEDDHQIAEQIPGAKRLVVLNKSDLRAESSRADAVEVSAETGAGLDTLRARMVGALDVESNDRPAITNLRHIALAEKARSALRTAANAARDGLSEEFVLADLQAARSALEEITGKKTPDDVLAHIFARFCIGK